MTAAAMIASQSRASWLGLAAAGARAGHDPRPTTLAAGHRRRGRDGGAAGRASACWRGWRQGSRPRIEPLRCASTSTARRCGSSPTTRSWESGSAARRTSGRSSGVSSIYLLVGEQSGLVGLALFLLTLAVLGLSGLRAAVTAPDPRIARWSGRCWRRSSAAALVGNLDHYFMNPQSFRTWWRCSGCTPASWRR